MTAQPPVGEDGDLITVRMIGLPVPVQARTQEHTDELIRELTLIAEQMRQRGADGLPTRLVDLVAALSGRYSMFTAEQEQQLADAIASGVPSVDLTYRLPRSVADAAAALDEILDEADDFCRDGQHLLTLATPAELVTYRKWFLDQLVDQAGGQPPVPWEDYRDARAPSV